MCRGQYVCTVSAVVHGQSVVISDVILVGPQSVSELASASVSTYVRSHVYTRGALTQAPVPHLAPDLSHLKWRMSAYQYLYSQQLTKLSYIWWSDQMQLMISKGKSFFISEYSTHDSVNNVNIKVICVYCCY